MFTHQERQTMIDRMRRLPDDLEACIAGLTDEQLTTHYLEGEWTVAQNVHHVADSHMNSYIRFKLIVTEDNPALKPYDQDVWAAMTDGSQADLSTSLSIIRGLHARWTQMLDGLPDDAWTRIGFHPEIGGVTLDDLLEIYSQHGHGHIDQITRTLAAQK